MARILTLMAVGLPVLGMGTAALAFPPAARSDCDKKFESAHRAVELAKRQGDLTAGDLALLEARESSLGIGLVRCAVSAEEPAAPLAKAVMASTAGQAKLLHSVDLTTVFHKHLQTPLTVRGRSGTVYHLSGEPSRLEKNKPDTAYLVFHNPATGSRTGVNLRDVQVCFLACWGGETSFQVDGDTFKLKIWGNASNEIHSELVAESRGGGTNKFTIENLFRHTGETGHRFVVPKPGQGDVEVSLIYYVDFAQGSQGMPARSVAFLIGPPLNRILRIPLAIVPKAHETKGVLTGRLNGRKFGVRLAGENLELYELLPGNEPAQLGDEIPIKTLFPQLDNIQP